MPLSVEEQLGRAVAIVDDACERNVKNPEGLEELTHFLWDMKSSGEKGRSGNKQS